MHAGQKFRAARPLPSFPWLLVLLVSIPHVSAVDIVQSVRWVAPTGTDGDTCGTAPDNACRSISYTLDQFPAAANMASNATIRVAAGSYTVPPAGIDFGGRPVSIVGEAGAVVDCNGSAYGFVAKNNEPSTAAIRSRTSCHMADGLVMRAGTEGAGGAQLC